VLLLHEDRRQMNRHPPSEPNDRYLYVLLGIAGALVGAKIAETLEFNFLGIGAVIGAILGAAFFVIGWRQLKPP
jgi:uncharacterized membrane protein YeaQ/YmgE (transglycosylase-associated protein family)